VTRFMLVRHGVCAQTDSVLLGRTLDPPLDERGRRQVEELALRFDHAVDLLEASPRIRTQETASAIARRTRALVRTSEALDEVDFGRWSGAPFAELACDAQWRTWNERRGEARTPAGQSMADVQARIVTHLHELHVRYPDAVIVLVTHAEVIRAAVLHVLGAPLDDYVRLPIDPASLTTLDLEAGRADVVSLNEPYARTDALVRVERCGGSA
jgi:broad specificity phosphatase PhoE